MTGYKLRLALFAALSIGLVPVISAYESSLVNVTSRVVQPAIVSSNHSVAAPAEAFEGDGFYLNYRPSSAFPGSPGDWDHTKVYTGQVACWNFVLTITNTYPYQMDEVIVFDRYFAKREIDGSFLVGAVDVFKREPTGGQILKRPENPDSFTSQIEFAWYPGLDAGDPGPAEPDFLPSMSELAPGEVQSMTVTLCTKPNADFQQEFKATGIYRMNDAATFSWLNPQGQRFDSVESVLRVEAIRPKPKPLPQEKNKGKGKGNGLDKPKKKDAQTDSDTGDNPIEVAPLTVGEGDGGEDQKLENEDGKAAEKLEKEEEKLAKAAKKAAEKLAEEEEKLAKAAEKAAEKLAKEDEKLAKTEEKAAEKLAKEAEELAKAEEKAAEKLAKEAEGKK